MRAVCVMLFLVTGFAGCRNSHSLLQPRHVEAPEYDRVAHLAHIDGHIVVTAAIDANGAVIETRATGQPMLAKSAMENLRHWTFEKPRRSPWEQSIVYDYRLEGVGGCDVSGSFVIFDFPGHVTIVARPVETCDPISTIPKPGD